MALQPMVSINVEDTRLDDLIAKMEKLDKLARGLPTIMGGGGRGGYDQQLTAAEKLSKQWAIMRDHSRAVVHNVIEIARRFASITGLMGAVTGLATGFGFLGFNALARSVTSQRMQQLTVGAPTYGGYGAARGAFGTYGNVNQMLLAVANARQDPSKAVGLRQLFGNNVPDANASPVEVMARLMQGAAQLYRKVGPNGAAIWNSLPGLSDIVSFEQARAYSNLQPGEIEQQRQLGNRFANSPGFNVSQDQLRVFQRFTSIIDLTRQSIENTFIRTLAHLEPGLERLVLAVGKFVTALLSNEKIGAFIDTLSQKLEQWAGVVGSPEFITNVENFIGKVGAMATAIVQFVERVNDLLPKDNPKQPGLNFSPWHGFTYTPDPQHPLMQTKPGEGTEELGKKLWEWGSEGASEAWQWLWGRYHRTPSRGPQADPKASPAAPELQTSPLLNPYFSPIAYRMRGGNFGTQRAIPVVLSSPLPLPVMVQFPGVGDPGSGTGLEGIHQASFNVPGTDYGNTRGPGYSGGVLDRARNLIGLTALPGQAHVGRFRLFDEAWQSIDAGAYQLQRNDTVYGKHTLAEQIRRWAPPNENATQAYIETVAKRMGIDPNTRINVFDPTILKQLLAAIARVETGREADPKVIEKGVMEELKRIGRGKTPDPGLHETPRASMQSAAWRPMTAPVVTVRNETGGSISTSSHLLAV